MSPYRALVKSMLHRWSIRVDSCRVHVEMNVAVSGFQPNVAADAWVSLGSRDVASCSCSFVLHQSRRVRRRAHLPARKAGPCRCAGASGRAKGSLLVLHHLPAPSAMLPLSPLIACLCVAGTLPCAASRGTCTAGLNFGLLAGRRGESGHHWVRACWLHSSHICRASKPAAGHVRGVYGGRRPWRTAHDHHGG